MNPTRPLSKKKKIINYILCVLFIIFAVIQLNDPDSLLWFSIYFIVAIICLYNSFKPIPKPLLIIILVALLIYSAFHFSLFIDYLNTENKEEIFGEMVYDKPYLEGTREFIGLLIAAFGIFYQLRIRKNNNK
ncbi:transmembrane 220 family protein [Hwangdonia seohaensis]|uniref:Transmembrane 220 family protein n=1 Tax=Hwangdonia seohaensis TaxID=1240727 RepID=A0ABW3RBM1_9FLAO|nr:transmembrane 220 family protein [Hwangdonia seohaensis]